MISSTCEYRGGVILGRGSAERRGFYSGAMPVLGVDDTLPRRPCRILVAGTSGSGKTTLAATIGARLGISQVEIDGLFHRPDWTQHESFEADVDALCARPAWVTEWQYSAVRERLAARADLVVWLDLPRAIVMSRVVRRTVRRRLLRQELWNGNIEPPLWTIITQRDHIVRWAWSTQHKTVGRIAALRERRPELAIVHLRSTREVDQWVDGALLRAADLPAVG